MPEQNAAESVSKDSGTKPLSLSEFLTDIRKARRQTLRDVQDATANQVSNAYLSQLETGNIKKPSPNVLYSLASAYSVPYEVLMEKAGYIVQPEGVKVENIRPTTVSFLDTELTTSEQDSLLEYLAFLRSRKPAAK